MTRGLNDGCPYQRRICRWLVCAAYLNTSCSSVVARTAGFVRNLLLLLPQHIEQAIKAFGHDIAVKV